MFDDPRGSTTWFFHVLPLYISSNPYEIPLWNPMSFPTFREVHPFTPAAPKAPKALGSPPGTAAARPGPGAPSGRSRGPGSAARRSAERAQGRPAPAAAAGGRGIGPGRIPGPGEKGQRCIEVRTVRKFHVWHLVDLFWGELATLIIHKWSESL